MGNARGPRGDGWRRRRGLAEAQQALSLYVLGDAASKQGLWDISGRATGSAQRLQHLYGSRGED